VSRKVAWAAGTDMLFAVGALPQSGRLLGEFQQGSGKPLSGRVATVGTLLRAFLTHSS